MGPGIDGWLFTGHGGGNRGKHEEACSSAQVDFRRGSVFHIDLLIPFANGHGFAYQLLAAMPHGTFIFPHSPAYEYYLCVTVIGLIVSWNLHNVVAWMEIKPFLSRKVSMFYISTIILVLPYWVVEIYANFAYFRNQNTIYETTRPMEPLFR